MREPGGRPVARPAGRATVYRRVLFGAAGRADLCASL